MIKERQGVRRKMKRQDYEGIKEFQLSSEQQKTYCSKIPPLSSVSLRSTDPSKACFIKLSHKFFLQVPLKFR